MGNSAWVPCAIQLGGGHQTATEKRRPSCEKADHYERAADELDRPRNGDDELRDLWWRQRHAKEFLSAVPEKQKTGDDAHQCIGLSGIGTHKRRHEHLLIQFRPSISVLSGLCFFSFHRADESSHPLASSDSPETVRLSSSFQMVEHRS